MSGAAFGTVPYSAEVDLWLDCEYGRIPLSQVASTFVVAVKPQFVPACRAKVVVRVDGQEFPRDVELIQGMSDSDAEAFVLSVDDLPF